MSFIDFLYKYNIWIIVILVVLIITVIGFLADRKLKMKKKKEEVASVNGNKTLNNVQQENNMTEQNMNNNELNAAPILGVNDGGAQVNISASIPPVTPNIEPAMESPVPPVAPSMGPAMEPPIPPVQPSVAPAVEMPTIPNSTDNSDIASMFVTGENQQ